MLMFFADNIVFTHTKNDNYTVIFPLFLSGLTAASLTIPMRYLFRRCWGLNSAKLILVMASTSLLAAMIWTPTKNFIMWNIYTSQKAPDKVIEKLDGIQAVMGSLNGLTYSFFMIFVWACLYFGINYHYRLLEEKQLHLEAVRLSHKAQIKMLRYQINPHFLFNTLNAISTLVLTENKQKANAMLAKLSTFLRFSLDNDPEKKIALQDEVKALMLYLDIEKTRFEERLDVQWEIQKDTETLLVPSLILQPLIENSIKYAIANMANNGQIKISAKRQNDALYMAVEDNGPNLAPKSNTSEVLNQGVGLNNIRERLSVLYPDKNSFNTSTIAPSGFLVEITIPIEM